MPGPSENQFYCTSGHIIICVSPTTLSSLFKEMNEVRNNKFYVGSSTTAQPSDIDLVSMHPRSKPSGSTSHITCVYMQLKKKKKKKKKKKNSSESSYNLEALLVQSKGYF